MLKGLVASLGGHMGTQLLRSLAKLLQMMCTSSNIENRPACCRQDVQDLQNFLHSMGRRGFWENMNRLHTGPSLKTVFLLISGPWPCGCFSFITQKLPGFRFWTKIDGGGGKTC